MSDTERERKTRKMIESLEGMRLACKQFEVHAAELQEILGEDLKSGAVYHTGTTS